MKKYPRFNFRFFNLGLLWFLLVLPGLLVSGLVTVAAAAAAAVELLDVPLDLLHHLAVELLPVAEEEEDLQQDEEGRGQEGLVPAVQQGGSATFDGEKV